jgi:hypothetical protein
MGYNIILLVLIATLQVLIVGKDKSQSAVIMLVGHNKKQITRVRKECPILPGYSPLSLAVSYTRLPAKPPQAFICRT